MGEKNIELWNTNSWQKYVDKLTGLLTEVFLCLCFVHISSRITISYVNKQENKLNLCLNNILSGDKSFDFNFTPCMLGIQTDRKLLNVRPCYQPPMGKVC